MSSYAKWLWNFISRFRRDSSLRWSNQRSTGIASEVALASFALKVLNNWESLDFLSNEVLKIAVRWVLDDTKETIDSGHLLGKLDKYNYAIRLSVKRRLVISQKAEYVCLGCSSPTVVSLKLQNSNSSRRLLLHRSQTSSGWKYLHYVSVTP